MAAIHNKETAIVADSNAVNGIELIGAGILGILWRSAPIHQKLSTFVEFRNTSAAVSVADEKRAVGQPCDVGRPVKQFAAVAAALAFGTEGHDQLSVVSEFVDDVELIVADPNM